MACTVNIEHLNEDSKLFDELLALYSRQMSEQKAVAMAQKIYKYTKTEEFKSEFGNWELYYNYEAIRDKHLKPGHRSKESAESHAEYLNKLYGKGAATASQTQGAKYPWRVNLNKPLSNTVSDLVNDQGEPLLVYSKSGANKFTSDIEKAKDYKAPKNSKGLTLPASGELIPYFLNIKFKKGDDGSPPTGVDEGDGVYKVISPDKSKVITADYDPGTHSPISISSTPVADLTENKIRTELAKKSLKVNPANSKEYIDSKNNLWDRVSTLKPEVGETSEDNEHLREGAARGTIIDDLLRGFIAGELTSYEDLKEFYNQTEKGEADEFTDEFIKDLHEIFKVIKERTKGWKIISDIPTLWGQIHKGKQNEKNIAGTIDLLAVNEEEKIMIIDLKTSTRNRVEAYKEGAEDKYKFKSGDSIQVSAYAELIRQRTGIPPSYLSILPVQVTKTGKKYTSAKINKQEKGDRITLKVEIDRDIYPENTVDEESQKKVEDFASKQDLAIRKEAAKKMSNTLKRKLDILTKTGQKGKHSEKLERQIHEISSKVAKNMDTEAIISFIELAKNQVSEMAESAVDKELMDEFKDPKTTVARKREIMQLLNKLLNSASAYSIIEEIFDDIENHVFSGSGIEKTLIDHDFKKKHINPVIEDIRAIKNKYSKIAHEVSADFLNEFNTDPNLSRQDIYNLLSEVSEDISGSTLQLNALAEAKDQILELSDKAIKNAHMKINREMHDFKNSEFKEKLAALEDYQKSQGGWSYTNYEKLYDFMLIKDDKGQITGHYIEAGSTAAKNLPKPQREFLEMFDREYKKHQRFFPKSYRNGNMLISILKSGGEKVRQDLVKGPVEGAKAAKKHLKESVTLNPDESEFIEQFEDEKGRVFKFVPIRFTGNIGNGTGQISPRDVSLDMAGNLLHFMSMAKNYKEKTKMVVELTAVGELLEERDVHMKIGGRPVVGDSKYGKGVPRTEKGGKSHEMYKRHIEMKLFGEYKYKEGGMLGTTLDKAKVIDALGSYNSTLSMGFNLFSGINNATMGHLMNAIEGAGGQFYSRKDYRAAKKAYYTNIKGFVEDATKRFKKNKWNLWMERYDIFQEFDENGVPLETNIKAARALGEASRFVQNAGEHMVQTQMAMAMTKSHRVINGKVLNYMDWIIQYNMPKTKKSQEEFNKLGTDVFSVINGDEVVDISEKEMHMLSERIKGVYQRNHGNYTKTDRSALQQYALGRLALRLRGWLKPGWDRRFARETFAGKDYFNQRMGANIGGNYTTAWNFLRAIQKENKNLLVSLAVLFDKNKNGWEQLPEWKKSNIKRTLGEVVALVGLTILISMLGDPDDEDDWMTSMAVYQAYRLRSELKFYTSVPEAVNILRSPAAALGTTEKIGKAIDHLLHWDVYERGDRKGELKVKKDIEDLIPYASQIRRMISPQESAEWIARDY